MSVVCKIRESAKCSPGAIALEWLDLRSSDGLQRHTYLEIWNKVKLIASGLRALVPSFSPPANFNRATCVVSPVESLVGILVDEGSDLPCLFLAVLVAQMVVLPLDPDDPLARLRQSVMDANPSVLVVKVIALSFDSPVEF
jgi:acyl-CoA synthetase (AMP-forming)/AMP-acid ligase II